MIRLSTGDRVWFAEERIGYTVKAVTTDGRFAVCTKPFPLQGTVMYSIIDFADRVRGTDDMIGSFGYETDAECQEAALWLERGDMSLSRRHSPIPLRIAKWQISKEAA